MTWLDHNFDNHLLAKPSFRIGNPLNREIELSQFTPQFMSESNRMRRSVHAVKIVIRVHAFVLMPV